MSLITDLAGVRGSGGGSSSGGDSDKKSDKFSLYSVLKNIRKKGRAGSGSSGSSDSLQGATSGDVQGQLHKGGKVRKTGNYRLRKGETVMTGTQMKRLKGKGRGKKGRAKSR